MKELSIEQKAKAYDEALINGSRLWECGKITRENYEYIFPEFKESEDDKIRKYIINHFQGHLDACHRFIEDGIWPPFSAVEMQMFERSIAWLEKQGTDISLFSNEQQKYMKKYISLDKITLIKLLAERDRNAEEIKESFENQGEQKPADKDEPKFKIGNWYLCVKNFYGKSVRFDKGNTYYCGHDGCLQEFDSGAHISIVEELYEYFRLWTIQDAKDGDVLVASDGSIFLLKDIIDNACRHYVALTTDDVVEFNEGLEHFWETSKGAHPATKEQRDLLFQKMKEAGYEWDAEKKELKKIEKKSLQWNISDYRTWQYIVSDVLTKHDGIGQYLDNGFCKGIAKYMQENWSKKLSIGQNSTWSEEDSTKFNATIAFLKNPYLIKDNKGLRDKTIEWLQLLKERVRN